MTWKEASKQEQELEPEEFNLILVNSKSTPALSIKIGKINHDEDFCTALPWV